MRNQGRKVIRYSISFQQQIVREIETDRMSIYEAQKRYGIKGSMTIRRWIRKFGQEQLLNKIIRVETMEEKDRIKQMEEEIKKLKVALADSLLAQRCLETIIDEANKEYGMDLKKSYGEKPSQGSEKNSG
jgi:transposase